MPPEQDAPPQQVLITGREPRILPLPGISQVDAHAAVGTNALDGCLQLRFQATAFHKHGSVAERALYARPKLALVRIAQATAPNDQRGNRVPVALLALLQDGQTQVEISGRRHPGRIGQPEVEEDQMKNRAPLKLLDRILVAEGV